MQQLRDVILYPTANEAFEGALRRFGKQRQRLYARFPGVLRARDNLAGSIGEYWGMAAFNMQCDGRPLIRCSSSFRDIARSRAAPVTASQSRPLAGFP